jgi:predicted DsbA family dithiol-disulfide isomerase
LQAEYEVEVDWRGFELNPRTPPGGTAMEQLFGGRARTMAANAEQTARRFGVTLTIPERLYNTRRALALTEWARSQGRLEPFRDAVMEANWRRGEALDDAQVLVRLAEYAGLLGEEARTAMDSPEHLSRVDTLQAEARAEGVTGIPTLFIGNVRVVGCQPYEVFEAAARQAGARRRA